MSALFAPASVKELAEVVRSAPRLLAQGAVTKPRLSAVEVPKVSTLALRGVLEYEPSEFTFTALAGTPVRELVQTLAQRRQYLPFDPVLVEAGATLGGTVAAGVCGPGRLRFGGIRDFILGAKFVDGLGRTLRMGGKVVKNAAGFDLPKFLVGSLGRFGVLAELTFKVFPAPVSTLTLKLRPGNIQAATRILVEAARGRWEAQALDIPPGASDVCVRLAGPAPALKELARDTLRCWPGDELAETWAQELWSDLREFRWAHAKGPLLKVAVNPSILVKFYQDLQRIDGLRIHASSGGNLAFVSVPGPEQVSGLAEALRNHSLPAMTLRGEAPLWCGSAPRANVAQAVKQALDPENRFPGLDE